MNKYWKVLFLLLPLIVYASGVVSNKLVERMNEGRMPVEVPAEFQDEFPGDSIIDSRHIAASENTTFRLLDDRFRIVGGIESIGDILLDAGDSLAFPFLGLAAILVVIKRDDKKNLSL